MATILARSVPHATALALWASMGAAAHGGLINVPTDQPSIQAAINVAVGGDVIVVEPGEYTETIDLLGKSITLRSTDPNDPNTVLATVINGGGGDSVMRCVSGEMATTVISGFVITNGAAALGGGMFLNGASPTIINCTFSANVASFNGGGMYCSFSEPTITNCVFASNTATSGGGIYNNASSPAVTGCSFVSNTTSFNGGGIYNTSDSSPALTNCMIFANEANQGGGIYNVSTSNPVIAGSVLMNNVAGNGGAIFSAASQPTIMATTVCSNSVNQIQGPYTDGAENVINALYCPPPSPGPVGACCVSDTCLDLIESACASINGVFQGAGTDCAAASCPGFCIADFDNSGVVDFDDLTVLLGLWGVCPL